MYCTNHKFGGATLSLMELEKFGTTGDIQELLSIREDIESLSVQSAEAVHPKIDVFDTGDAFQVLADVAGVSQENLEIAVQGNVLMLSGLREPISREAKLVRSERQRGHFERNIELPTDVKGDEVQAHLANGVLTLTLPKE